MTGADNTIAVSVRLLDDDGAPWPAPVGHVVFTGPAGREHRLSVAPGASDVELGAGLRQVIAYEIAARDADLAGRSPEQRRAGMRVVGP
ncbi:MAG: hypothetical protein ACRDWI_06520 [Jiangellaceae bacterium]